MSQYAVNGQDADAATSTATAPTAPKAPAAPKTVTVDIILDLLEYTIPRLEFWFTHLAEAPHCWTSNLTAVRCHSVTTKSQFRIINNMPASYERRAASNGRNNQQSMADLKIRRLNELNLRLREDLDRPRVTVSQASKDLINYCNATRDYMVPSVWGPVEKREDPYAPQQSKGCCTVM